MLRLALFQPDIPQNLGTNLRTAACFGIDVDIIEPCGFPFDDRKFRRAGMDYIDHVNYKRHSCWEDFVSHTEQENSRIILLSSKTTIAYTDFSYEPTDVLLLGRETSGVTEQIVEYCGKNAVTIPMKRGARSLNVAVAGSIVLSEAIRQIISTN